MASQRRRRLCQVAEVFLLLSGGAHGQNQALAQANSTAQSELLRQQERERVLRQQQEQTPDVRLDVPRTPQELGRMPTQESPCFRIDGIRLEGDSAERFQWAVVAAGRADDGSDDPVLSRCLGSRGINLAMRRVQNSIIDRGFITTRVLAQPQDLTAGTLVLTIVPGRIRSIRFAEATPDRATQWNAVPMAPGDLLNLRDIEQALENFKRVPTADADIQIVPSDGPEARPGESDVIVMWKQAFPFRMTVSADDSGTKATGKYQGAVTVSYDHWWTLNDLFYFSANRDLGGGDPGQRGTRGATAHYSLPFGYWLLGATASTNRYYQAVAGVNQTYIYSGESTNSELKLSRLVYRDAVRKTTVSVGGWFRSSKNYIDDTEVEVQRRRMAGWSFGIGHREFMGAATLDAALNYRRGTGAMDSLQAPEEAFNEGTSRPQIVTADVQLNLPFSFGGENLRYGGNWRGQWNGTPLVPQDRFAIGGRYTVRGFDGEVLLSAERGWLLRNDLGWNLGSTGQELYLGIDYGEVAGPSSEFLPGRHLSGAVVGLRGSFGGMAYDLFVGQPISRPTNFITASSVAGVNLNWSF